MSTYERTHPWLSFQLDLRKAAPTLWLLLGEAQSKVHHVAGVPLMPAVQKDFLQLFLAKGVRATTAIEGNTLSEEEVLRHLRGELEMPPSKEYLQQEVQNVVAACNDILHQILVGEVRPLDTDQLLAWNRQILHDLPLPDEVAPGQLRRYQVGVGRYRGAPPEDLHLLLDRLCHWLNDEFAGLPGYSVAFGLLKAILAHLYLAWIHPFGDGNGRTARLLEFQILLIAGVPGIAAHLLSNHYNQTRSEYYRQLDRSHQGDGDPLPFVEYALQGFVDQLKEQIAVIQEQQLQVHWVNFIHDQFRGQDSRTNLRRRRLVLDLSAQSGWTPISRLRHVSARIAEAYAGKTEKTVIRDVNALVTKGLLARQRGEVRARRELMVAFLPAVRDGD